MSPEQSPNPNNNKRPLNTDGGSSPKDEATPSLQSEPVKRTYRRSGFYAKDLLPDELEAFDELWSYFEEDFPGITENIANRLLLKRCIVNLIQLERAEPEALGTSGDKRPYDYKIARTKQVLAMYDALNLNRKQSMKVEEKTDLATTLKRMGADGSKVARVKYGVER